jgi:hypothetical protein
VVLSWSGVCAWDWAANSVAATATNKIFFIEIAPGFVSDRTPTSTPKDARELAIVTRSVR